MEALNISLAAEPVIHIGNFIVTNSYLTSLVIVGLLLTLTVIFKTKVLKEIPKSGSLQNILELIFDGLLKFYTGILGNKHGKLIFPFATTLFLYILISNWSGLLPGVGSIGLKETHNNRQVIIPFFRAPTADLNTTLALALTAMVYIQIQGIKSLKLSYLGKFIVNPFKSPIMAFVGFLESISEIIKVISFAFRLFGNIFAGEVLILVISAITYSLGIFPFLGLEVFVGLIQALVFTMLVLVFTAGAVTAHH